jgi:hypothetical protein
MGLAVVGRIPRGHWKAAMLLMVVTCHVTRANEESIYILPTTSTNLRLPLHFSFSISAGNNNLSLPSITKQP